MAGLPPGWLLPPPYAGSEYEQADQQPQPTGLAGLLNQGQAPQPQMQQPNIPSLPQIPTQEKRPVWKDILGTLLDTVAVAGGRQAGYWPGVQQGQEEDKRARTKLEEMIALQRQKMADRAAALQDWQQKQDYERQNPQPGEQERLIDAWSKLPDGDPRKALIERAVRGYQYTQPVMEARQENAIELADRRRDNSITVKKTAAASAAGAGGRGGAKPLTATARAKYIAEAQAAISRGADPAKVRARLAEMGVQ